MTCSRCGGAMSAESTHQLCPRCLLAAALDSGSTAAAPTPMHGFSPPSVEELQKLFPSLEILELLGKGGMGAVYKARQITLDRFVAVKILPPHFGGDASFAERFSREAKALARLSHANIVGVYDFGRAGELFYFLMEFVDGVNIRQAMRAGTLSPVEALKIVPQICDALQFAHDEGIVHRDIKPENILLDKKGRVKIADFGLAKLLGPDSAADRLTGTQQAMGTIHYMAPEQVEGAKLVDHRADIYSLGVTFYEMLTGELPLGRFQPPSQRAAVDARLDQIVLKTLEKSPGDRYQHVSQVKTDVESLGGVSSPNIAIFGRESNLRSGFPRYLKWAGLPTLASWACAALLVTMVLLASPDEDGMVAHPTWVTAALIALFGVVVPLSLHYLWAIFGQGIEETAAARARHAGNWMVGLGVVCLGYVGLVAVWFAILFSGSSARETTGIASLGIGLGAFGAVTGMFLLLGGSALARLEHRFTSRAAAILALLPLTYLWPFTLPVGILGLMALGRRDVSEALSSAASQSSRPRTLWPGLTIALVVVAILGAGTLFLPWTQIDCNGTLRGENVNLAGHWFTESLPGTQWWQGAVAAGLFFGIACLRLATANLGPRVALTIVTFGLAVASVAVVGTFLARPPAPSTSPQLKTTVTTLRKAAPQVAIDPVSDFRTLVEAGKTMDINVHLAPTFGAYLALIAGAGLMLLSVVELSRFVGRESRFRTL